MESIRTTSELTSKNLPTLGAKVTFEIPRTSDLENLFVLFDGSITLSAGSTGLITDGIMNLITSVELTANSGRDPLISIPFAMLTQGNYARRKNGCAPDIAQPGIGIAVNAFSISSWIDVAAFGSLRPKDVSLRENNYESLELTFRFAPDLTGVFAGAFTSSAQNLNLRVGINEVIEVEDNEGKFSSPVARVNRMTQAVQIAGIAKNYQHKLTPGQGLRGLVLRVTNTATPPVLSDALIDRIRINVGKVQRRDNAGAIIKAMANSRFPIDGPVGYYFMDFADRNGTPDHLSDALDLDPAVTNGADSFIYFDTLGSCNIEVMNDGYIPLARSRSRSDR